MQDSILNFLPPAGDRKAYRLQASLSLEEAAALEKFLVNPTLPFQGDMSTLVRTALRAAIVQLEREQEDPDSFLSSIAATQGAELLRWSANACDQFAIAAADHLGLALHAGNTESAVDVVHQVVFVIEKMQHTSAREMLKRSLVSRGFTAALQHLRQALLDEDKSIYWLDNLIADVFA